MTIPSPARSSRTVTVSVERGSTIGHWDVAFESEAVPGTLAAFAGVLALHRLDITSAIMTRTGDRVLDRFDVVPLDDVVSAADIERLAEEASAALRGTKDLGAALKAARQEVEVRADAGPTSVKVSTESDFTTGISVRTADRVGLLHDIASTLTRHGMRTRAITVLTFGGMAHDSFRVVDGTGAPPKSAPVLEALRLDLLGVCG